MSVLDEPSSSVDLQRYLEARTRLHLLEARGDPARGDGARDARRLLPATDGVALRADFASGNAQREAWSVLYARHFAPDQPHLHTLAGHVGVSRRTIRRRQVQAYDLLAADLHRQETRARAAAGARGVRHNVPSPSSRFIGRERELSQLRDNVAASRLVTLVGPGGIGKSRLAMELARGLAPDYADGAWWVDLTPVADDTHVTAAVARAMGIRPGPGSSLEETVLEELRLRHALVVLDNGEHLADVLGALADRLLTRCPGLQIVVTSRRALGVEAEIAWTVPPMGMPGEDAGMEASRWVHYDALRLFADRAELPMVDRLGGADAVSTVRDVCRRMAGMPLAIEMAAARARGMGLEAMSERWTSSLRLPLAGAPRLRPQHDTLRATIAWSVDLLEPATRTLLGRLSVYRDGFSEEGAAALDGRLDGSPSALREALEDLARHSLIERRTDSHGPRWRMLEPIRQVESRRLHDAGEHGAMIDRMLDFLIALAESAAPALRGAEQRPWLDRLEDEEGNLLAALHAARSPSRLERGLRLAIALQPYVTIRGRTREGWTWLEALLAEQSVVSADADVVAEARTAAGGLGVLCSETERGEAQLEAALAYWRARGVRRGEAEALHHLATAAYRRSDLDLASERLRAAVDLRRAEDLPGLSNSLQNLGVMLKARGEYDEAKRALDEARDRVSARGDVHALSDVLSNQGNLALDLEDFERAETCHAESLRLKRALGDREGVARQLLNLAAVHESRGDPEGAADLYAQSLEAWRGIGGRGGVALALGGLGGAYLVAGRPSRAAPCLREYLTLSRAVGSPSQLLFALDLWARLEDALGRPERALCLVAFVTDAREASDLPAVPAAAREAVRIAAAARVALGLERAAQLEAAGASMDVEAAVTYALRGAGGRTGVPALDPSGIDARLR